MLKKELVKMRVEDLIPYDNNPRLNAAAVPDVIASIQQCENLDPIEVDENNVILSGHTRREALLKLNYTDTEVIRITGLSEEQKRKYRILANKTSESADWDLSKLEQELQGLDFNGYDFNFDGLDLDINADDFGEDFSLPEGEKSEMCTVTFTLHVEQKALIEYAMKLVKDDISETFGNTNANGNALYEVVRQWAEQKK